MKPIEAKNLIIPLIVVALVMVGAMLFLIQERQTAIEGELQAIKGELPKASLYDKMTVRNFQGIMSDFGIRLSRMEQSVHSQQWRNYQQQSSYATG